MEIAEASVVWIDIDNLKPHPRNPRVVMREDVVSAIANQVAQSGFDPAHALIVRPVNGHHEILSGHHRREGAAKAGIAKVPCWVRDLDDDSAYMSLVTSNAQGELAPLEIGLHALECVGKAKAGRGKKGGLSEYAEAIGKSKTYLSQMVQAAEVAKSSSRLDDLMEKTQHLVAIHSLPKELWTHAVEIFRRLPEGDWTVDYTETRVRAVKSHVEDDTIAPAWRELFLPTVDCAIQILDGHLSPKHLAQLAAVATSTSSLLADHPEIDEEYRQWLKDNVGGDAWDMQAMQDKRAEMEKRISDGRAIIDVGDWKEWLARQDEPDLILTDPPYSTDVPDIQSLANDLVAAATAKVKKTGRVFICIGAYPDELQAYLDAPYDRDRVVREQVLVWTYRNTLGPAPTHNYKLNWQAILYYRGVDAPPLDCPVMLEQFAVQDISAPDGRQGDRFYVWQKPDELAERLIRHSTTPKQSVIDPFAGSGTFILAAARLGRMGSGCELKADVAEIAISRGCCHA